LYVVVIVTMFERGTLCGRMVRLEVAMDDLSMMSVLGIPRVDMLGRQEQQSSDTDCGENGDDLAAEAGWHQHYYPCELHTRQTVLLVRAC
jgi:hypothetical protein